MQKGSAPILILIALVVILGAGTFYWLNFKNQSIPDKLAPPTPPVKQQMEQANKYKNNNLGLELNIPSDLVVTEETEEQFHKRSNGDMRKNFKSTLFYEPAEFVTSLYVTKPDQDLKEAPLSVWVFENPDNLTAAGFYKKYWYYPFIWGDFTSAKEKIAPNIEFMIGESTASSSVAAYQQNSPKYTYLPRGDKMFLFKETDGSDILKSLVFTN